jgi:hypothetical protein
LQNAILPVLCTQSSKASQPVNSTATKSNQITVVVAGNEYLGYRNQKSFRFLGIRYADPPARFEYSQLYSKTGLIVNATTYGSECAQGTSGSEDCLFLNIQTPYIPKAGESSDLRPVYFYIHGGGFTSGSGADPSTDGGNMASREDVVSVQINYRLSTLGFLAVPGTEVKGNFGIGDQIIALEVRFLPLYRVIYADILPSGSSTILQSLVATQVVSLLMATQLVLDRQGLCLVHHLRLESSRAQCLCPISAEALISDSRAITARRTVRTSRLQNHTRQARFPFSMPPTVLQGL